MFEEEEFNAVFKQFVSSEYDMNAVPSESTGLCVIFNSCTFSACCLPTRKGSEKDVESIRKVFGDHFGFEVRELKDKTTGQMEEELKAIGGSFKPAWRCLVCFFLSHGLKEKFLVDLKGDKVNVHQLVQLFDGKQCSRMIGKPKLFFVQMCRGFDRDEYLRSQKGYDTAADFGDLHPEAVPANISPDRDRLVCYATTEGRMAPIDPEKGSLFIQTLTKVLEKVSGEKTIEEALTMVTLMVDKQAEEQYKVCPTFESTLVGRLVFKARPKNTNTTEEALDRMQKLQMK